MKYWPFCFLFFSSFLHAQEIKKLTETVVEIQNAYPTKESVEIASELEDKAADICAIPEEQDGIDEKASLPPELKAQGWKVLFEVKYNSINQEKVSHDKYFVWNTLPSAAETYFNNRGQDIPTTLPEMNQAAQTLFDAYKDFDGKRLETFRNAMIIRHMENASTADEMYKRFSHLSKDMSSEDKLGLLTSIASYANYDIERSGFFSDQNESTKGKITPFMMMREGSKGGICGDIHSTVSKFAEIAGFESFTIGYALADGNMQAGGGGPQHVISAVVDPNDKSKVHLINYSTLQTNDLSDGNSLKLTPTDSMQGTGIIYRIFKNAGDAETGKMQQIGVLPTSLRGFFDELTHKQYQLEKAMPQNQNFTQNKMSLVHEKEKIKVGDKTTVHKQVGNGLTVYQGSTQEGEIWGVAVSTDTYKKMYSTETGRLKKTKYFGTTLSGSLLDNDAANAGPDSYLVYLKIHGGKIYHLIESPQFKFGGALGYAVDAVAGMNIEQGKMSTVDGNLETFAQVFADYQKNNTNISMAIKLDNTIALKDQNLMTDFSKYKSNLHPFKPNAVSASVDVTQRLNDKTALTGSGNVVMTNMGSQVILSTGVIVNRTMASVSYTNGLGSTGLSSNRLQNVNLLQNTLGFDGLRANVSHSFSNKSRTFSGSIGGYAGISNAGQENGGVSLKLNLGNGSKKKKR